MQHSVKYVHTPRDKEKDDTYFNCHQEYEYQYVAGLYEERQKVYFFLRFACETKIIKNETHMEVYLLIKEKLGFPIPI